jgi:tRNA threonylcarbamoyladenosine biosynthesis protein TsaE
MEDTIILSSAEDTQAYGAAWAARCKEGDVIALQGVLGAGKTQLVKGLAQGLGFTGEVTSPTFTIIHEYTGGRLPLYHLDLYRFETEGEAQRAGMEDYLPSDGVTVVEWPERILGLLPPQTQFYTIEVVSLNERIVRKTQLNG